MAKRYVYVVTHGDKFKGPNPGMTPEGFAQVAALRGLIPRNPSLVVIGTGQRHLDVAAALYLTCWAEDTDQISTGRIPLRVTPVVGGPESLEDDTILLANGTKVARDQYTGTKDGRKSMSQLIDSLPDDAVVCAGRPSMILLGKADAKSAAVYRITEGWLDIGIREVVATGVSEPGTV